MSTLDKSIVRERRKCSIRKRLTGTSERPRLSVFRSIKHIYAQVIDDERGQTLLFVSSQSKEMHAKLVGKKKREQAKILGAEVARRCLEQQITKVAFDRNGFIYHGRVASLAEGAREAGLQF